MAVRPLNMLALCDGYGGFELGLKSVASVRTVCRVERDSYAAAVLVARMEEQRLDQAPIWDDLETFDGTSWRGRVDLITAGFPCQPFSAAGKQRGVDDHRWLWPSIRRIVRDVEPGYVFLENVPQLVRLGLPEVLADLAELGFDAEWGLLAASAVGAPHTRNRCWIMAHPHGARCQGATRGLQQCAGVARSSRCGFPPGPLGDIEQWEGTGGPIATVRRVTDGPPAGLADALHLGGNGLVPQCAAEAFRQLTARLNDE